MRTTFFILIMLVSLGFGVAGVGAQATGEEVTAGEPIVEEENQDLGKVVVESEVVRGRVIEVAQLDVNEYTTGQRMISADLVVEFLSGEWKGTSREVEYNRALAEGEREVREGDVILVQVSTDSAGGAVFYFIDHVREGPLLVLFGLFAVLVLVVGKWKGLASIFGLVSSFVVIYSVILPGIQEGYDPIVVAIIGAAIIMGVTFYLSHGISKKTTLAIAGTLCALILTGILGTVFVDMTRLSGFGAEEAAFLQVLKDGSLNMKGLLLAGIIIGTLGVLDDITISQVSIVKELTEANKNLSGAELFFRAMNVGRDHIASLVNTLILVYAGSSLPLLLLFTIDESRSMVSVLNYEMVAEEVVRTLVGSIGLVAAVPITTLLAVKFGVGER